MFLQTITICTLSKSLLILILQTVLLEATKLNHLSNITLFKTLSAPDGTYVLLLEPVTSIKRVLLFGMAGVHKMSRLQILVPNSLDI